MRSLSEKINSNSSDYRGEIMGESKAEKEREKFKMVTKMMDACNKAMAQGEFKGALAGCRKLRDFAPEYGVAWYLEGKCLYFMRDLAGAAACCNEAIGRSPQEWMPHALKAKCLFDSGEIDSAMGEYESALKLKPDSVECLISFAYCYICKGNKKKAFPYIFDAFDINPSQTLLLLRDLSIISTEAWMKTDKVPEGERKKIRDGLLRICKFSDAVRGAYQEEAAMAEKSAKK